MAPHARPRSGRSNEWPGKSWRIRSSKNFATKSWIRVLRPAPEGRHDVAHRACSERSEGLTVGLATRTFSAPKRRHMANPVQPRRGLVFYPHAYPPLPRWATFFRPLRDWPKDDILFFWEGTRRG